MGRPFYFIIMLSGVRAYLFNSYPFDRFFAFAGKARLMQWSL